MKKLLTAVAAIVMMVSIRGGTVKNFDMERANASFRTTITGEVTSPAPEAVLIKNKKEFSAYLSDPSRFFDGRFMFYEKYEGDPAFFENCDLIAIIVKGEAALVSLERGDGVWRVSLEIEEGKHALYFLSVPKEEDITGVELK